MPSVSSYTTNSPTHSPRPLSGVPVNAQSLFGARNSRGNSHPPPSPYVTTLTQSRPLPTPTPYNTSNRSSVILGTSAIQANDIDSLRYSSVSHFRTLSQISREGSGADFAIDSGQDVAGMQGRKRLQRTRTDNLSSWERMTWMDKRRQYIQAYEYLCHIGEAKEWLEDCIGEPIPPIVELEEALRDGVVLAKLTRIFAPELVPRIFEDKKLQYRHSDNIGRFFRFLKRIEMPDIFIFELTDLYNKKNIPKVIYCLHALSFLLFRLGMTDHSIGNLVGKLEFTEDEIQNTQRGLDIAGVSLPSFRGVNKHFVEEPEPEPEPEETEEERIERELREVEYDVLELQNICRGALLRMKLGRLMEGLWDEEEWIIELQARIRGMFARTSITYRLDMARWATDVQAYVRGFLIRQAIEGRLRHFTAHERLVVKLQARYRAQKVREEYKQQKLRLESATRDVVDMQAALRGALARKRLTVKMSNVYENENNVTAFQAKVRGALARRNMATKMNGVYEKEENITTLQAKVRGALVRRNIAAKMDNVYETQDEITTLQARVRGALVRRNIAAKMDNVYENQAEITTLQARARGALLRRNFAAIINDIYEDESAVKILQAKARGALLRRNMAVKVEKAHASEEDVVAVQSAARGALVRMRRNELLKSIFAEEESVRVLQSTIRGKLLRDSLDKDAKALEDTGDSLTRLAAAARGVLVRRAIAEDMESLQQAIDSITALQAAARAAILRKNMTKDEEDLQAENDVMPWLQAAARGYLFRQKFNADKAALEAATDLWIQLQAAARGNLVRWNCQQMLDGLEAATEEIIELQACARGVLARNAYEDILSKLDATVPEVIDLQSHCRGAILRWEFLDTLEALDKEVDNVIILQAHIRGFLSRDRRNEFLHDLRSEMASIVGIQSAIRGALVRRDVEDMILSVQDEGPAILVMQAVSRAVLERKRFFGKLKHFRENMDKVIKIQSFVRAKQQGEAYKSLMGGKNPPVGTVKNFVHLLNDSDFDFDEEIEFERMRKNVVQHVRANELAEAYVDQLDIKIALLVKNKITLDEVIKHQKRFTGHVGNFISNTDIGSTDPFDLKALNNNSRKRLERYQQMFFALQTQPHYLAKLFRRIKEQNTAEKELKRIEALMMGLFGYAQKRREEYYLLKLIVKSVKEEVDRCEKPEEYLRGNFFWVRLVGNYVRSPRDRKFMRDSLASLLKDEIIDNEELDLESDPMQIYRASINNEELRTGQRSTRNPDVGREQAIRDRETRETFIEHLQCLRTLADDFIAAIEDNINRMPYGVRYIAQQSYEALADRFPHESPEAILQVVEHFIYQKYFNPVVLNPDTFGIIDKSLTPQQKKNLGELSKMLSQISSGRLFSRDNVYLQPLNEYVAAAISRMKDIFRTIIDVPDAEARFEIDEFEDLTSKQKPTLYIKMSDIFAIHRLVAQDIDAIAPGREDQLKAIIAELGSVQTSEAELKTVGTTEIGLQLDPHFQRIEDPDSEIKALFVETKRCILYIIRVQTGANLMEILVKPITPDDEDRWQQLLLEEKSQSTGKKRGAYADATTLSDVSMMTYVELKRIALENILALETAGKITRKNQYQDLLNVIAIDIRTKHRRRIQRARELDGVKQTLEHLNQKAKYLEGQLQSYNDYIEQAMVTLQTKKGKKKVILPFTRQYFHMRELQRSGRVPKFGSYKYTARGLADKGVLVRLDGFPEKRWDKVNFTVSSDEVGVFFVEASNGSMMIPGASAQVLLDDLLQMQFHNNQFMLICDGMIKFNVNLFLHLLFRKFYRDE
ncbi:iqgap-related protein [Rhizina undulata]